MIARYLLMTLVWIAVFGVVLFGAAGDWRWPEAWVFLAEYAGLAMALVVWLARHDQALLRERFAAPFHHDQALWDRVFLLGVGALFFGWLALIALDARRFAWSQVPIAVEVLGAIALAGCLYVTWRVFRINTFAVPQVRVQAGRAQTVISDGPYRFIRHPMYSGALLMFLGIPLLLGSWVGLAVAPFLTLIMATRILGEEQLLRRDLPGYEAYARRVRYRLVPGVW